MAGDQTRRRGLKGAVGLLTVLGGAATPTRASVGWFPVVGAVLGLLLGLVWWAAGQVFTGLVPAALVLVVDFALTGMIHADGLIDSADGLLPHMDRERRLAVMAEPQVGAFGIAAIVGVVVLRLVGIASAWPGSLLKDVLLFGGVWMASRSLMALGTLHLPYVRPGGLATALGASGAPRRGIGAPSVAPIAGLLLAGAGLVVWHASDAAGVMLAEIAGAGAVFWLAARRIGGYTGDVLGAAGYFGESLALVLAGAHW